MMMKTNKKDVIIEEKIRILEQIIGHPVIIGVVCYKGKIHLQNMERYKPEFFEEDEETFDPELLKHIRSDYVG